ncbi:MAG TPA: Holliday junction branch migration protein RuvA [Patescibacteria group bacterium]
MIGLLKGIIEIKNNPYIVVDVNGVGYKVFASPDLLSGYGKGDSVTIYIHTHVREDSLELYGFSNNSNLELFELLIGVSGIGPKTAIGVFSLGNKDKIIDAIRRADVDFFVGVPRLGRKNAQKIIIDLKNKIGAVEDLDLSESEDIEEVISALTSFGFSSKEAKMALKEVEKNATTTSDKIRLALKYLGK